MQRKIQRSEARSARAACPMRFGGRVCNCRRSAILELEE